MARGIHGIGQSLVTLSVLAVLAGCTGGPGVTQNALPAGSGGSGTGGSGSGGNSNPGPSSPSNPSNPGGGITNPGPTTPPPVVGAIGDPATANANTAVLTTTRTTIHNLNTAVLGSSGWRPTALIETNHVQHATAPRVAFDAAGNGFAVWSWEDGDVVVSRYTEANETWSAPVAIDAGIDPTFGPRIAVDRQSGDAVVTYAQNVDGVRSFHAIRYTASTTSWGSPEVLENSAQPVASNSAVAIAGPHAAAVWRQEIGEDTYDLYLSRLVNGSWTAPQPLENVPDDAQDPGVAVDLNGNVTVVWRQHDSGIGGYYVQARRWDNATQALGPIVQLDGVAERFPHLQVDAQGNAIVLLSGDGIGARHFDVTTGQWSDEVTIHNDLANFPSYGALSVDAGGNAIAVWLESDGTSPSVYARRYNVAASAWGNAELLENLTRPAAQLVDTSVNPTVSLNGGDAVVAWLHGDIPANERPDLYAVKLNNGAWDPVTLIETRAEVPADLSSAISAGGDAAVVWMQRDGGPRSIYQARNLAAKYEVLAGATWQSIAAELYGVNSVEGGNALQAAMGGGTLTVGMMLSGFPSTLSVTAPIPPYYTVLATDTWSHIAQRVYGVTDLAAITQLQSMLGNPTLTAGLQLVVPASVTYNTSVNYRAPLDWSRVNTTTTMYYQIDEDLLTVPLNNWSTAQRMETENSAEAAGPAVAFDNNGNGIAVWALASDIIARRFDASTGQWGTAVVIDTNPNFASTPRLAMDRTTGDAVVTWAQSDGVARSMYVSSFDASANSWSAAQLVENSNAEVQAPPDSYSVAMRGEHAAVVWRANAGLQPDGDDNYDVYVSRLVAGTWTAPALLDMGAYRGVRPEVAIDANGNMTAVWAQYIPEEGGVRINTRRWNNTTQSYGPVIGIDGDGDYMPRIQFDDAGNGIVMWSGEGVFARRYSAATDTWESQQIIHNSSDAARGNELAVDANGDALIAWVETDGTALSVYARFYDAATGTWANSELLETLTTPVNMNTNLTVSLVNGSGLVAWAHGDEDVGPVDLYAARLGNGAWGEPVLLETRDERVTAPASHIDGNANATVLWVQADGYEESIWQARSAATPYFEVPAGATWQSLANTLYGVSSEAAADALRTAMGNPTLTTGLHLTAPPTTLTVNPTVPTHYVVQTGDTWQSIAQALYGTTRSEAATALWVYLGRPTLTVGQQLLIPAELSYTIDEE